MFLHVNQPRRWHAPLLLILILFVAGCGGLQTETGRVSPEQITIANLRNNVENLRSSLAELQRQNQVMQDGKKTTCVELAAVQELQATLEARYRLRLQEAARLEKLGEEQTARMQEQQAAITKLEEAGKLSQTRLEELTVRNKEFEGELAQKRANYESLRAEHFKVNEELVVTTEKLAAAEKSSQAIPAVITEQLKQLRVDNDRLNTELKAIRANHPAADPALAGAAAASDGGEPSHPSFVAMMGSWIGRSISEVRDGHWNKDSIALVLMAAVLFGLFGYGFVNSWRVKRLKRKLRSSESAANRSARAYEGNSQDSMQAGNSSAYRAPSTARSASVAVKKGSEAIRNASAAMRRPTAGRVGSEIGLFAQTETISTEQTQLIGNALHSVLADPSEPARGGNPQRAGVSPGAMVAPSSPSTPRPKPGATVVVRKEKASGEARANAGVEDEALLTDLRSMIEQNFRDGKR